MSQALYVVEHGKGEDRQQEEIGKDRRQAEKRKQELISEHVPRVKIKTISMRPSAPPGTKRKNRRCLACR